MDTIAFLRKILPATGLYCAARLVNGKFRNQPCDSIEELAAYVLQYDAQGVAAYHACAAYRERVVEKELPDGRVIHQYRLQKNVRAVKALWLDLDVDAANAKKFPSQDAACVALVDFCRTTGLPVPLVVSSGGGIHCYWTLTEEIGPDVWKQTAEALKALAAKLEFSADPACTGDAARVLRSIGTWNRKDAAHPRAVELVADAPDITFAEFNACVAASLKSLGVKPPETHRPREMPAEALNAAFAVNSDFPPCSAKKVADRCQQLARMRDTRGDIPEPYWYAGIQLMCSATEGDELIHEWSNGYVGYSHEETTRKIQQIRVQALGPTLCSTFEGRNPGGCEGCPHKGKIATPAQLGAEPKNAPPPVAVIHLTDTVPLEVKLPAAPFPFARNETGVWMEEDGIQHKIYNYDLYPFDLVYDEHVGHEVVRLRHLTPQKTWLECAVRSALIARPIDLEMALRDNHIQPLSKIRMAIYMDKYIDELRKTAAVRRLFRCMGWKNDCTEFVLGDRLYQADGKVLQTGFAHRSMGFLGDFKARGSLQSWVDSTTIFNVPGLEPHAFMLLCGFAAPLLELGGRDGFTVSALGETGVGKSTMGKFLASIYGHPEETWIGRLATANARVERLGAYRSIPAYMDEITTIDPKELRDIVYMIPTGKGKDALTRNRESREAAKWKTILIVSTNDSLHTKLQQVKQNAEAEGMRVFEFRFPRVEAFGELAPAIHGVLHENYGTAGAEFIRRLVAERGEISREIGPAVAAIEKEFQMEGKERFWSQAAALALYGGDLAYDWGLIQFDPERIRAWLHGETQRMRKELQDAIMSPITVLGQYLDTHVGERLVVSSLNAGMHVGTSEKPRGVLSARYEKDIETLWISRKHVADWLAKQHHNYNAVKDELYRLGVLIGKDAKKVLGAGTDIKGGQVPCWKVNMKHPELLEKLA